MSKNDKVFTYFMLSQFEGVIFESYEDRTECEDVITDRHRVN